MRRKAQISAVIVLACGTLMYSSCRESSPPANDGTHAADVDAADPLATDHAGDTESVPVHAQDDEFTNPLLGKKVKGFQTVDPDGNRIDLDKHLGKDVILLDFWATWCVPCLMAMPEVEEIAKEFKDRGLVFYAVNVGEDPDTVMLFLALKRLDIPVAMDFDGKIQSMYHARDLPHTIVIGKDGRLQVDHRGYWQGFGKELHGQVQALLDGKDLTGGAASE
jgi:thiol-disulfide isomerase/thioredoxin